MIVYQLRCANGHRFEAWFRGSASYGEQREAGAVVCPACGDTEIDKAPMAPRIASGGSDAETRAPALATGGPKGAEIARMLRAVRKKVEANCDYVGDAFPEEARKIHYGETDKRDIYGEATDGEARELDDEGIDVQRIPWSRQDS